VWLRVRPPLPSERPGEAARRSKRAALDTESLQSSCRARAGTLLLLLLLLLSAAAQGRLACCGSGGRGRRLPLLRGCCSGSEATGRSTARPCNSLDPKLLCM
jgi:hypothetical protein